MEVLIEPAKLPERPAVLNQDSEERQEQKIKPVSNKKKIIRKKNKSKAIQEGAVEHNAIAQVNAPNTMAPFGIFESQTQKCQRLENYFRRDIQNFYKTQFEPHDYQILDSFLNYNLIQLADIYNKDLSDIWKQKLCSLSEIRNYLEVVSLIKKHNGHFTILFDQIIKKYYLNFTNFNNVQQVYEITQLEAQIFQNRQKVLQLLRFSQQKFTQKLQKAPQVNGHHKMSQISMQIAFLFKQMYDSTKTLKGYITNVKQNIQYIKTSTSPLEPANLPQSRYVTYLIKKLVLNALQNNQIDYLNFFKNNQLVEHNYGPPQATFLDQKEFQQFMRKKKNKKGKKGKYVLHTACLGCCSSYFQQYNPFSFCQQCYVRFHRSCYTGYPVRQDIIYINSKQEKDVLCETCYNKKITPNYKIRGNECDYCGIKGLLSVSAGQSKRIHIFCMLLNGLWTVKNSKLEFKSKTDNKVPFLENSKCIYCHSGLGYLHFCSRCEKYVHASCAYFNGWRIDAQFDQNSQNVELRLLCCEGVPLQENEKRRKFVTNFRKQAYSF